MTAVGVAHLDGKTSANTVLNKFRFRCKISGNFFHCEWFLVQTKGTGVSVDVQKIQYMQQYFIS